MRRLELVLGKDYDAYNISYPSRKHNISELAEYIHDYIDKNDLSVKYNRLHFVTHSMGGIVARQLIMAHRPPNLGRVVMIAPPNHGSEVADFVKNWSIYKKIYGPAGQQLVTTGAEAIYKKLEPASYEAGIIAGSFSPDPICSHLIKSKNDSKVSVKSTKLDGMSDHITLKKSHTMILFSKATAMQTLHFLKHGNFDK